MRKQTKALVALLLLAIVLSAFGIFASFAEEPEATTEGPVTIYDQATKSPTTNNGTTSVKAKTADNGVRYHTITYPDKYLDDNGVNTAQKFFSISPSYLPFADGKNADQEDVSDSADYLVIDLDVGTDTNAFSKVRFQTRFYYWGLSKGAWTNLSGQNAHWRLWGDAGDDVYFTTTKTATKLYPEDSKTEWNHVTFVVDVSGATRNTYAYYNGVFVGKDAAYTPTANYLWDIRVLLGEETPNADFPNESLSIANTTIKAFPKNYAGELATDAGKLGKSEYTLSDFSDLAYTLENLPENKVAEITRGEEVIAVNSFAELEDKLEAGDSIKLYRDITRAFVIPNHIYETLTFDLNGWHMVEPIHDWIITTGSGEFLGGGNQVYETAEDGTRTLVTDALNNFIQSKFSGVIGSSTLSDDDKVVITFLNDIETKNAKTITVGERTLDINLNGHTWNILVDAAAHLITLGTKSEACHLIIRDGTINKTIADNLIYMTAAAKAEVINCNITSSRTLIDQRDGNIIFRDCALTSNIPNSVNESFISTKSFNDKTSYLTFEGCTLTANTNHELIAATSVSSSQAGKGGGRYGGMQLNIDVNACIINALKGSFMTVTTYASEHDSAAGCSKANQNYANVSFTGCDITVASTVVQVLLPTLHSSYTGSTIERKFAEGLSSDNNIDFVDCEVNAAYLLTQSEAGYSEAVELFGKDAVDGHYTYDTDLTISGTKVKFTKAFTSNSGVSAIDIIFTGVTPLTTNVFGNGATQVAPIVSCAEGFKLAYASDETYDFIVTNSFDTYTYKLGAQDPVEFYWNLGETANIARVVTLADSEIYTYTWVQEGNAFTTVLAKDFKVSAMSNLTLVEDFQFNLYIPAEQYAKYGAYLIIKDLNNNILTGEEITIDGVDYIKFKAKDVAPKQAEDAAMTVTIEFAGAYGDTYSVSNGLTVLDYTEKVIAGGKAEEIAFIDAILNYISAAYACESKDSTNVDALISADAAFATEIEGEAKLEGAENLEIALNYGAELNWGIKATAAATVTVEYTYNGNAATETVELAEGDIFFISFKAYDMINSIKVNGAEVNLKGYYEALTDDNAKTMVLAIYNYVKAAAEYKAA